VAALHSRANTLRLFAGCWACCRRLSCPLVRHWGMSAGARGESVLVVLAYPFSGRWLTRNRPDAPGVQPRNTSDGHPRMPSTSSPLTSMVTRRRGTGGRPWKRRRPRLSSASAHPSGPRALAGWSSPPANRTMKPDAPSGPCCHRCSARWVAASDGYGLVGGIGESKVVGRWPTSVGRKGSSSRWPSASVKPFNTRFCRCPRGLVSRGFVGGCATLHGCEQDATE